MDSNRLLKPIMKELTNTRWDNFSKIFADPNLYFKYINGDMIILILYVDDLLVTWEEHLITQCKRDLTS